MCPSTGTQEAFVTSIHETKAMLQTQKEGKLNKNVDAPVSLKLVIFAS